jgi:hypothetical protein
MKSIERNFARIVEIDFRFKASLVFISSIWYLALFPGRLGFDYSESIRMMQSGESTDWWTASFWWFLKITSFNGTTIMVSSAISLFILGYALFYLSESVVSTRMSNRKALIVFFCSPLYGGFGLNVSHDVFIAAGILLFTGFHIRHLVKKNLVTNSDLMAILVGGLLLITTHYGPFIIAMNVFLFLFRRLYKFGFLLLGLSTFAFFVSGFGVTQVPKHGLVLPIIGDLKCVAQHPQAEISRAEWEELLAIAPKSEWKNQTKCSQVDVGFRAMPSLVLADVTLTPNLIKTYLGIAGRNAAIVAMAHIQRASIALPPPFFDGPQNQVVLNPDLPIGLGTNTALQSYAGVLHPSIDEPSVANKISYLKILEVPAQGLIFIINQASWFWGWGGLWLWPIGVYCLVYFKRRYEGSLFPLLSGTLILHGLLLIFSDALPRYVMSTIILGNLLTLIMIFDLYAKYIKRDGRPL